MKPPKTTYTTCANMLSLFLVIGTILYLAFCWNRIPEQIPAHYNLYGEVDRWGSRGELLLMPIFSCLLYGLLTLIEQFPAAWNTGIEITPDNEEQVYRIMKGLLVTTKLEIILFFTYTTITQSLLMNMAVWSVILFLIVIFGTTAYYLIRLYRLRRTAPPTERRR